MLCSKPRSKTEVVNDLNGELVNFYRVVRYHIQPLLDELEWTPNSREEFFSAIAQPGMTDIQRAARFFLRNALSFGGMGSSWCGACKVNGGPGNTSRVGRMEKLIAFNRRMDRVCIENRPAADILRAYDSPDTLFFCDPPYIVGKTDLYAAWGAEDMERLRSTLSQLRGRWILTVCDCQDCRRIFREYRIRPVSRRIGIRNRSPRLVDGLFRELIITPS